MPVSELIEHYYEQFTKPFEHLILDWVKEHELEFVIFYPQEKNTILITWASPDRKEHELFREIDIIVEDDDTFRLSGGSTYHEPTYRLAWLPYRFIAGAELRETLDTMYKAVQQMNLEDLTDMDEYLEQFHIRLDL